MCAEPFPASIGTGWWLSERGVGGGGGRGGECCTNITDEQELSQEQNKLHKGFYWLANANPRQLSRTQTELVKPAVSGRRAWVRFYSHFGKR